MIKELYVRGYRGRGTASTLIRWFTFGEYSHVSFIFVFDDGHVKEIESIQGRGVWVNPELPEGDYTDKLVPILRDDRIAVYGLVWGLLGADYDWKGIWGFVRRKNNHNKDKWFCSELVAYVLYKVGYPLSRRDPYRETPSTVMESLQLKDS